MNLYHGLGVNGNITLKGFQGGTGMDKRNIKINRKETTILRKNRFSYIYTRFFEFA